MLQVRLPGEALQAVALPLSGGVPQACHMHGVSRETSAVYAMIAQHMPIKAVIVPHLFDAVILKKVFENDKHLLVKILLQTYQT